jgi:predicted cupin superfamily sugar epimerase
VVAPGFEFRDFELASVGELSVSYPELASLLEFPL